MNVNLIDQLKGKFSTVVVNRISIFFFLICLLSGFLYVLGTIQGFMDETQLFLLRIMAVFGILLVFSSVCGFFIDLAYLLGKKKIRYLATVALYLFWAVFGTVMAAGSYLIMTISAGSGN